MANNYFQFKQFTVQQQHCAMKVCTDACVFGAFVARHLNDSQLTVANVLDIGTGTGLLSLMVAQKTSCSIDALEIDEAAAQQAKQNFEQSPWDKRLNVLNADALQFDDAKKYDCIICNPPFFEGDLKSGNKKKDAARHDTTLTLQQLLLVTGKHLSPQGFLTVLLPYHRAEYFIEIAEADHYFLNDQLLIQHTSTHPFFRAILFFSNKKTIVSGNDLVIKNADGSYTPEFNELLQDYYLNR